MLQVPIQRLDPDPELPVPSRIRAGDAAADLPSRVNTVLGPGDRELIPTGFAVAIPPGACGLLLPRSGLALKHGITLVNAPGLIDSGYRGELQVMLLNTSRQTVSIQRGQRIAQLLVLAVPDLRLTEVAELPPSHDGRDQEGWGSSG